MTWSALRSISMRRRRRTFSPGLRAKVTALKGDKTVVEWVEQIELYPHQISSDF
jgi:hypothetical protein